MSFETEIFYFYSHVTKSSVKSLHIDLQMMNEHIHNFVRTEIQSDRLMFSIQENVPVLACLIDSVTNKYKFIYFVYFLPGTEHGD